MTRKEKKPVEKELLYRTSLFNRVAAEEVQVVMVNVELLHPGMSCVVEAGELDMLERVRFHPEVALHLVRSQPKRTKRNLVRTDPLQFSVHVKRMASVVLIKIISTICEIAEETA